MSEQTFRSPNFYEREFDQSTPAKQQPVGTPVGIIGTSLRGPAFVPVTVSDFDEYKGIFGGLDSKKFGPYAANEFLKHRQSLTYLRLLGAGVTATAADITKYSTTGRVTSAGVKVEGIAAPDDPRGRHNGAVQFLTAKHSVQTNEAYGCAMFTDNDSFNGSTVNLVRGMILTPSSSRVIVLNGNETAIGTFSAWGSDDAATCVNGKFKIVISSSLGDAFNKQDNSSGLRVLTASLNPTADDYYAKILNTNPDKFVEEQHLLYADFPVDNEMATATDIAILSGSANTSSTSGETATVMRNAYGAFDTRYAAPKTTWFISQPFGPIEHDLFYFETIDDGEYANSLFKVSISNIKKSVDDSNRYGTFNVEIRAFNDSDLNPRVLELFPNCSMNPQATNYVAKLIGDRKISYNFDATVDSEKRLITSGKYDNNSKYVRIRMSDAADRSIIPDVSLPFGFRGHNILKTTDSLTDSGVTTGNIRVTGILSGASLSLSGAIVPPIPMQFKVTKGDRLVGSSWVGEPGVTEIASSLFYWGAKFERFTDDLNPNTVSEQNKLLENYTKFVGIQKLDTLVTGSGADTFNNNKFSLAKVVLGTTAIANLTSSINEHMREAAYVRNAKPDQSRYTVVDAGFGGNRITFATLLAEGTAADFNRFSPYAKFTNFFAGGYDGLNFLDKNNKRMNDKSTSFDALGGAEATYKSPGMATNMNGSGQSNANVSSIMTAINIMTDPMIVNHNVIALPGIKETFITDYAAAKVKDYGLAYFVMDIPSYDDNGTRIYDDSILKPSVNKTASSFSSRAIDNNYVGTYWPEVVIDDADNSRRVTVPASVAALGALSFNDKVRYPWFAPAGFNRASLDFVKNVKVRLNVSDRDLLSDARINPIATFPRQGFVIWGQKTLQINKSSLDRVNVRRMILEIKRNIIITARKLVFEQNTPEVRNNFVSQSTIQLAIVQTQQGIEQFKVVMNESNNTQEDIALNKLNGRILVVPTRSFEFIAIDFIITRNGVTFI